MPLPLLGRFKEESGQKHHTILIAAMTASGMRNYVWCARVLEMKRKEGITRGWLFAQDDGTRKLASDFEEGMMVLLESI